jgi:hypothetical protein
VIILEEYVTAVEVALSPAKGRCRVCGECRAAAMLNRDQICYRCDHRRRGLPEIEEHHLFGGHKGISVQLPVNEHRVLDAMRLSRPPYLTQPGADLLVNVVQALLLSSEVAVLIVHQAQRECWAKWITTLTELLAAKAREGAEAALLFSGHITECPGAKWHQTTMRWTP